MSDFFEVTTDYILSMSLIIIGLFFAFGRWYATQEMEAVWGSMVIQVIDVFVYCVARIMSEEKAPLFVKWLNIMGVNFMPISIITGYISELIFH